MAVSIDMIGGNCPVQAEGTVDEMPFYFRARGEHWSFSVAGTIYEDPIHARGFYYSETYEDGKPFAAGWMSEDEARAFIEKGAQLYRERVVSNG